jgi:hypothetical protein
MKESRQVKSHPADKLKFATKLTDEDREQIMGLYREVWGEKKSAGMDRIYEWKFESGPFMPPDRLQVLLYRAGGRIVAHLGGIPCLFKYGDRYQPTVWIMDFLSHPSYRGKGLWLANKMVLDNAAVVGVAGEEIRMDMWRMIAKRFKRPHSDLGTYRHLVKKVDIAGSGIAQRVLRLKPLIGLANGLWRGYHRLFKHWRLDLEGAGLEIKEVDRFGEEINRLWELVKDDFVIIPKRTDAYLNWRFVEHPTNRYFRFLLYRGEEIRGYLVLRLIERKGEKIGRIVDLLASRKGEEYYRGLISFALDFFEERAVETVQAFESTCPELSRALKRNGFSHRLTSQRPMKMQAWQSPMRKGAGREQDEIPPELFHDPKNWYFTYADSDFEMLPPEHTA